MYLKKEIIISFFIITISASNIYMTMIWLYVFLQDFLIPFLCGPDLQCVDFHDIFCEFFYESREAWYSLMPGGLFLGGIPQK
jgi:hypothetical protein